jgi:hypothetical protein
MEEDLKPKSSSVPPRPLVVAKSPAEVERWAQRDAENEKLIANDDAEDSLPELIDAADFLTTTQPQPLELVSGILHQGSKLVLGGGSKSYKTWTLLDLALSVSHGLPWLGRKTNRGRVLYVNFEIQSHAWQHRIAAVAHAKGIGLKRGAILLWNLRGHAADFKDLLPRISEQTAQSDFALIILDPIYKLYGRTDENKAGDVAALLNGIEALAVKTGAAVAFGAHFAKGNAAGKEAIDRISGSGVFARDPDSILIFTQHEDEGAFVVESILRNFPPVKPFGVRWIFPLFEPADELDTTQLKRKAGRSATFTVEMIVDCLGKQKLASAEWQKLCAKHDIKRAVFYRLLKKAEQSGVVKNIGGKWLVLKVSKVSNDTSDTTQSHKSHIPLGYETMRLGEKAAKAKR